MSSSLITPFLIQVLFAQQAPDLSEIQKATAADAAASGAGSPSAVSPVAPADTGAVEPAMGAAPPAPSAAPPDLQAQAGARRPGASLMNPAMSVILDGTYGYYGRHRADFEAAGLPVAGDDPALGSEGVGMQEIELAFQSAVDPYLEAALFLTIPNLQGLEVEEGYLVTTSLPANLQVKAGSFRSQLGRNNTQHLHLQHFTRRPLFTALLFGADGLRGPGVQASVLLPLPWFTTFYAEAFSLPAPDDPAVVATFGGGGRRDPAHLTYTAVLEQFWDLTDSTSLLVGLNGATGRLFDCAGVAPTVACADAAAPRAFLYGGDLTLHFKPANVSQTYASLQWTTELFFRSVPDAAGGGDTVGAGYTEPVVQFARRWYLGGRFDLVGLPSTSAFPRRFGYAASLTFAPSEFSRFRLYAQELAGPGIPSSTVAFLQTEISLGAHGAHPF